MNKEGLPDTPAWRKALAIVTAATAFSQVASPASAEAAIPRLPDTVIGLSNPDKWLPPDITEPTGKIYDGEFDANLGLSYDISNPDLTSYVYKVKIIDVEEFLNPDYQGSPEPIYIIKAVFGEYEDGSLWTVREMIGKNHGLYFTESTNYFRNYQTSSSGDSVIKTGINMELIERLVLMARRNAEIAINTVTFLNPSFIRRLEASSEPLNHQLAKEYREGSERLDYNKAIYQAMQDFYDSGGTENDIPIIPNSYKEIFEDPNQYGWSSDIIDFQVYFDDPYFQQDVARTQILKPA